MTPTEIIGSEKLAELEKHGYVIAPLKPTQGFPSMAQAGAAKLWDITKAGIIGHDEASAIYEAMIAAWLRKDERARKWRETLAAHGISHG